MKFKKWLPVVCAVLLLALAIWCVALNMRQQKAQQEAQTAASKELVSVLLEDTDPNVDSDWDLYVARQSRMESLYESSGGGAILTDELSVALAKLAEGQEFKRMYEIAVRLEDLGYILPAEEYIPIIKQNFEAVVLANGEGGYYDRRLHQKSSSSKDPVGYGTPSSFAFTTTRDYEYYGDFAVFTEETRAPRTTEALDEYGSQAMNRMLRNYDSKKTTVFFRGKECDYTFTASDWRRVLEALSQSKETFYYEDSGDYYYNRSDRLYAIDDTGVRCYTSSSFDYGSGQLVPYLVIPYRKR